MRVYWGEWTPPPRPAPVGTSDPAPPARLRARIRRMNRTARNVALAGAALALLFFATGAKAQEEEKDKTEGDGYGKAPPDLPPKEDRPVPQQPGAPGAPQAQPPGTAIIPNPQRTGRGGADSIFVGSSDWPYRATDLIKNRDPSEYAEGVLVIYLPWSSNAAANNQTYLNLELIIEDWAELYGYQMVHIVYETPDDFAYTAEAWYRGAELGEYDLEVSYLPAYLKNLGEITGALPLAFAAGLVNWLHGP